MVHFLEKWFPKTMRNYWYSARRTGRVGGINEAIAIIYSELKVLSVTKSNPKSQERMSELVFILANLKKLI